MLGTAPEFQPLLAATEGHSVDKSAFLSLPPAQCPELGSERFLPSPPYVSLGFVLVAFPPPFWALLCCPFLLSASLCGSFLPAPTFFFLFILYPTFIENT